MRGREQPGIGLIGFGKFGRFCLEAFQLLPDVRIAAVAETDVMRQDEAERLGLPIHGSAEELLALREVELVHISTPPMSHARLAIAAARAGKHIFCEKPLALSLEDASTVLAEARNHQVLLGINYVMRHNPLAQRLHDLLRLNLLGELHHISLENWATDEPIKPEHWFWDRSSSGGIWIEHGVHFFDLVEWLSGRPVLEVFATGEWRPDGRNDRVWALARYDGGLVTTFHHAFTQPERIEQTSLRLAFARGYASLHGWIPTQLVLEALVDEKGLEALASWAGDAKMAVVPYKGQEMEGWAFGRRYRVSAHAKMTLELPQGKLAAYREAIAAGLNDMIMAIRNPEHRPRVTPQDAWDSLAAAIAACRSADTQVWQPVPRQAAA